jgi:hypothetical protein
MQVKYIAPSLSLFYSILIFNILPGIYIIVFESYEMLYKEIDIGEYETAATLYLYVVIGFTILFLLTLNFFKIFFFRVNKQEEILLIEDSKTNVNIIKVNNPTQTYDYILSKKKWVDNMGYIGCFFVFIYFVTGGYEKITSYGSGMDAWEFRIIGYGDRSGILTAILEISRKIILPFSCLYFLNYSTIKQDKVGFKNYLFLFCLLLAGIMTFDRAPILLFFVLVVFKKYSLGASLSKTILLPLLLMIGVILIAGITTFIQYNITEFSFISVFETGIAFFLHRTVVVPSVASIELSFYQFPLGSNKLNLEFSRLGALFGKDYISIRDDDVSIYVSPVGFIADIWRNFGILGCIIVSIVLGYYFAMVDYLIEKLDPLSKIAISFTSISLCFYFIFGVFFSQGVFAQFFFLFFVSVYLQIDGRKRDLKLL